MGSGRGTLAARGELWLPPPGPAALAGAARATPWRRHAGGRARTIPITRRPRPEPGAGVFETLLIRDGVAVNLEAHLRRLGASCAELGLTLPASLADQLRETAMATWRGALRADVRGDGIALSTRELPARALVTLEPVIVPGGLGAHKWVDRTLIDALSGPGLTPLVCDLDGTVLEAGYAAVLAVVGTTVLAPVLDGRQLPSLSRELTLRAARERGLRVELAALSLRDLEAADAIVLCSSLRGAHLGRLAGAAPPTARAARLCEDLSGAADPDP
jgi:para-aminobenzoate synthetase/4-amino-4-deoxychorismate lyase